MGLFGLALWVLHRETAGIRFADVVANLRAVPWHAVGVAVVFTAASYAALTGYDWLALRHIGRKLPLAGVALTSFVATAVGHNLGVAMLSGGAVRYRLYSAAGLSAAEDVAPGLPFRRAMVAAFLGADGEIASRAILPMSRSSPAT